MSILLTKVRQPQTRKDILRRVRLVDTIHQNIHRKLTFISAPAGYGKTTLLADFASEVDAHVCWYLIGAEEKNLADFVHHIVVAFQQQFEGFGTDLEKSLSVSDGALNGTSLAIDLINEVETQIDDFTVLVLDDYHLAGENIEIVEFIEKLIEFLPDQLRVLIGSRSVYGIPTANLYIRDELVTISADQLRFRTDELQRLVLQNYHIHISDEQAQEFTEQSDGWIVAILLALRAMDSQGSIPQLTGGTESIYEYLAEEVVNRQTPELRDFMYCSSILGDFNEELCNYIRESKDSARFLSSIEERNLFVTRTEGSEGYSYRYHQLFAEFLYQQFEKHDPSRLAQMHERAANWYKDLGEWEPAIQHKLSSGNLAEAAQWMDQVSDQLYIAGRQSTLTRWFEELTKTRGLRREAPKLALYQAKILGNSNSFEESKKLLDFCEPLLAHVQDHVALANVNVTRGMIHVFNTRYDKAIESADKALEYLKDAKNGNAKIHQKQQAERLKATASHYIGESEKGVSLLNNAAEGLRNLIKQSDGVETQRYQADLAELLTDLGLISLSQGNLLAARLAFEEVLDLLKANRGNHASLAMTFNNIAYTHYLVGSYKEAWTSYSRALQYIEATNRPLVHMGILEGRGNLLMNIEEFEEAKQSFQDALVISSQQNEPKGLGLIFEGLATVERHLGNHSQAMTYLREAAINAGYTTNSPTYCLHLGEIYLDMGQLGLAKQEFKKAFQAQGVVQEEQQALAAFYLYHIELASPLEKGELDYLDFSLTAAAKLGYDQFLVITIRPFIDEIKEAQGQNVSPQLKDLLARAESFKASTSILEEKTVAVEAVEMKLEIKTLGVEEVRKNGEAIPSTAWRSSRSKALFFYFVDQQKVSKEKVGLEFWPDFSLGKMSSNFHATLWRVRKALGDKDAIIFENDAYMINPSINVWLDSAELEQNYARSKKEGLQESERIELLRLCINLYNGEFLPTTFFTWTEERRMKLQSTYIDALIDLAEIEKGRKRFKQASEYFSQVLDIDPYRDNIHLSLMNCLVEIGKPSAAKAHFRKYEGMLRQELNAKPIPELQDYFEQLSI